MADVNEGKRPVLRLPKPVEHPEDLPEFGTSLPIEDVDDSEDLGDIKVDPRQLPEAIFYIHSDKEWEQMLPYLIGKESTRRIKELAAGRNVKPVILLRQGIIVAADLGVFEAVGATEKRNPKFDDDMNLEPNRVMFSVLSAPCMDKVLGTAKEKNISNKHALYFAVKRALECSAI